MKKTTPFFKVFNEFYRKIAEYGKWNSLSSCAIKLGCPGIVDIYEGCEHFRYTLVDPDNRTFVNFEKEESIKSALHQKALNTRNHYRQLFLEGEYIPLKVTGESKNHVIAFLRRHQQHTCLVAGARLFASFQEWKNTKIHLPNPMKEGIQIFTEKIMEGKTLLASDLFSHAPFAWVLWHTDSCCKGN